MKNKLIKALLAPACIASVIWSVNKFVYPNVVTGISPIKNAGQKAKDALDKVANSANKDSALSVAVEALPTSGNTLEERVAYWLRYDYNKIDSMQFMLVSGIGISATNAESKAKEGYTHNQVVVRIFSNAKSEEYFLYCANGLVAKRWPDAVYENKIGETRKIEHTLNSNVSSVESSSFIVIRPGQSLCDYFPLEEALSIAVGLHLPTFANDSLQTKVTSVEQGLSMSKKHKIIVLVHPGQMF